MSDPHPLCVKLKELRKSVGFSLADMQEHFGVPAVLVGSYERGDRVPPLPKLDMLFNLFGYRLEAVPTSENAVRTTPEIVTTLRGIASQLEVTKTN